MIMLNFDIWNSSIRWRNLIFFGVRIVLKRIYVFGYKWTPFCKVESIVIWRGTEEDKATE